MWQIFGPRVGPRVRMWSRDHTGKMDRKIPDTQFSNDPLIETLFVLFLRRKNVLLYLVFMLA